MAGPVFLSWLPAKLILQFLDALLGAQQRKKQDEGDGRDDQEARRFVQFDSDRAVVGVHFFLF